MFQWIGEAVFLTMPPVLVVVGLYALVCFICFYRPTTSSPKLYYTETEFNKKVVQKVSGLMSEFRPTLWLRNRHVQTVLGNTTYLKNSVIKYRRKYVDLDDNGVVAIDIVLNNYGSIQDDSTILILLTGLAGNKGCLMGISQLAAKRNYRVIIFNKRGHDKSHLATPVLQTFGDTRDLRQCVEYLHERHPRAKIAAIGYSAGAGLLQSYLGSYSGRTFMSSAVLISSGYNVAHLALVNMPRIYERFLVECMKRVVVKPNERVLEAAVDMKAVYRATSLREFDHHLYCRMHGYRDVAEMWTDVNPMNEAHCVDVPVMCIHSLDDPLCVGDNIPYHLFQKDNWMLVTTDKGGHCGFVEDLGLESWADRVALNYVQAVSQIK